MAKSPTSARSLLEFALKFDVDCAVRPFSALGLLPHASSGYIFAPPVVTSAASADLNAGAMMKLRNTVTGAEIETSCKVSGGNWVEVAPAASSHVKEDATEKKGKSVKK